MHLKIELLHDFQASNNSMFSNLTYARSHFNHLFLWMKKLTSMMFTTFEAWLKWQEFGLGTVEVLGSIPCHKINIYEKIKIKTMLLPSINLWQRPKVFHLGPIPYSISSLTCHICLPVKPSTLDVKIQVIVASLPNQKKRFWQKQTLWAFFLFSLTKQGWT